MDVASGAVIGFADGMQQSPLAADAWQDSFASDDIVAIDGAAAPAVIDALTRALQAAVLTAAQEAGLSH